MKKTLAIVLAIACVLTMSIIALAEGVAEDEEVIVNETTADETAAEAAETEDEAEIADEVIVGDAADTEAPADGENAELDAWMAMRDPSMITEEEWMLFYVLEHTRFEYIEGEVPVEVYTNTGTEELTLIIYWEYGVYTPITDWEAYWANFDPDVTDPHEIIGTDTFTVVIPAGETVYVPMNEEMWLKKDIARGGYIGGSYGDVSVYIGWNY